MSWLTATLYERNLFYQQLHFKWKCYSYLRKNLGILHRCRTANSAGKTLYALLFFLIYLMDFTLGVVLLITVHTYPILRVWLKTYLSNYVTTTLHLTRELIIWLMGIPAGLKLNTPLDHFLGNRFLTILELWEYFYSDFISLYLTNLLLCILLLAPFGITLSLTALHDFLKFLNLCSISFFIFASRILSLQLSALKSLARLFMGKKWNILRERVDSCDYDTSQLLVGTIMFTILLFLLPTTGVYFLIFLLLRVLQFGVQLVLRVSTVCVNRLTVAFMKLLSTHIQDQPLTKLKMTVRFNDNKTDYTSEQIPGSHENIDSNDTTSFVDIRMYWNGKEHSVDDIQKVIESTPTESILKEIAQFQSGYKGDQTVQHTMLNFIGSLL